jgi:hypothetical protein
VRLYVLYVHVRGDWKVLNSFLGCKSNNCSTKLITCTQLAPNNPTSFMLITHMHRSNMGGGGKGRVNAVPIFFLNKNNLF